MSLADFTRTYIISEVKRQLQQKSGTAGLFAAADFNAWADDACLHIASLTRCLRTEATANSVSCQQAYTIPDAALGGWAVTKVEYGAEPLEMVPWDQMEQKVPSGMTLSSSGTPRYWSPYGRSFRLFPKPDANNKEIRAFHAKMPATLSADTVSIQDLGFPQTYGPAIIDFMAHRGHLLRGDGARAQAAWALFEMHVAAAQGKEIPDAPGDTRGSG